MIIDVSKLQPLVDSEFTNFIDISIMSEHWVIDDFKIQFYLAVAITIPYLMYFAHSHTPEEYNENEFLTLVQKEICCFKKNVPTLYFIFRGLSNIVDFYKDLHFAIYQPHSNMSLSVMLYISIFLPAGIIVHLFYKIGICADQSPCKRFFSILSMYFGGYFAKLTQT